ncbi:hypothetical protein C8F04DRAFT_1197979 [Mycena alexandri]|uniref:Uncharacterized protein n=1 Tax=Mycena alexandri TaxID=1745969 RepID=A0AAD6WM08_9AGAR|nr:hypothetical protein C8F04DRAFT_1197979 [Mycena alexandri]
MPVQLDPGPLNVFIPKLKQKLRQKLMTSRAPMHDLTSNFCPNFCLNFGCGQVGVKVEAQVGAQVLTPKHPIAAHRMGVEEKYHGIQEIRSAMVIDLEMINCQISFSSGARMEQVRNQVCAGCALVAVMTSAVREGWLNCWQTSEGIGVAEPAEEQRPETANEKNTKKGMWMKSCQTHELSRIPIKDTKFHNVCPRAPLAANFQANGDSCAALEVWILPRIRSSQEKERRGKSKKTKENIPDMDHGSGPVEQAIPASADAIAAYELWVRNRPLPSRLSFWWLQVSRIIRLWIQFGVSLQPNLLRFRLLLRIRSPQEKEGTLPTPPPPPPQKWKKKLILYRDMA